MQTFIYYRGKSDAAFAKWAIVFIIILILACCTDFIVQISGVKVPTKGNTVLMLGYAKAAVTFVKYLPQVYLNWKRKSTVGWSIENVILDFTGGSFSLLQGLVDMVARGKGFDKDAFNIVKFMLSIIAMSFDIIFFI